MGELVLQFSTAENSINNWASALIRRLNHSPFSHVDFILPPSPEWPDGACLGASDQGLSSKVYASNPRGNPRGVAVRPLEYQKFGTRRRMILECDDAVAKNVIDKAMSQLGKPFDSAALHDFLSDHFPGYRDWRNPDVWFCAEYCLWSLEEGPFWKNPPLPWPKNRVSPTDVLLLLLTHPRWVNRDSFWDPIPGLKLGLHET